MTLLLLAGVAVGAGFTILVVGDRWRSSSALIGVAGSVVILWLALGLPPDESVVVGDVGFVGTPLVRAVSIGWSAGLAVLGLLELAIGGRPTVVGPGLLGLAVAALALATRDAASSVAALAAGGVAGVLVPGLGGWLDGPSSSARLATTSRGALAVLGSGLLGLAAIAWGASAAGPLGGADIVGASPDARLALGLALLAMVVAVAIRSGLIPFHVWAARFMEGVSPLAIPAAFAWGTAVFILAALDWSEIALGPEAAGGVERLLIIGLGFVSLILGGLAAMFHDDIEHVLGYSILQDAGLAVLAFASLELSAASAAADWLVASATIKTALAAWAAVVRATYGGHRLADLAGWARHSPALGLSFAAILIAAVGLPGMALFDARSTLITGSLPGIGSFLALLVTLMPAIYLGRIGLAGLSPMTAAIAGGPSAQPTWSGGRAAGWSPGPWLEVVRAIPAELRANRTPLMTLGVLLLAAMALVTAMGGVAGTGAAGG
jgi:formate hydrogenlyase subunit 3/multisubunit Na+/H+ antiporter MnhD subunit